MAVTYEPIATTTLGSAGQISFTSIPQTYTDLRVVCVTQPNGTNPFTVAMQFNSDNTSNYSQSVMWGDGSSAGFVIGTNNVVLYLGGWNASTLAQPSLFTSDIFSYTGSTNKSCINRGTVLEPANTVYDLNRIVGLWRSTAAITTITLMTQSRGNLLAGTTATLYGIKAA